MPFLIFLGNLLVHNRRRGTGMSAKRGRQSTRSCFEKRPLSNTAPKPPVTFHSFSHFDFLFTPSSLVTFHVFVELIRLRRCESATHHCRIRSGIPSRQALLVLIILEILCELSCYTYHIIPYLRSYHKIFVP